MSFEWCEEAKERGWHYNARMNVYQKVNGRVFVYISRLIFGSGYMAQLYSRGHENMTECKIEVRTSERKKLSEIITFGEEWLSKYESGDDHLMSQDTYHVTNPAGVWGRDYHKKKYWI